MLQYSTNPESKLNEIEFENYLTYFSRIVKETLGIQYTREIYISVLLSLIKYLTRNTNKLKIIELRKSIVLYNLSPNYKNYISVIVYRILLELKDQLLSFIYYQAHFGIPKKAYIDETN